MPNKLLEGIKVADFTWALVGPITTKVLADYGAEVIKIEGWDRADSRRISPPFKDNIPGLNRSGCYNPYNTGKLSLALNLAHPDGIEVAKRLVAWADIVVENFRGGAMKRMGLGYERLKMVKPDIIMLSSCPMGQTGPYPNSPGIGAQLTALSGILNIAGWPDRGHIFYGPYTDFISPYFNVLMILAALDYRRRTGKGQYLDLSQYEDCLHFIAPLILDSAVNQHINGKMGNRSTHAVPHNAYRCRGEDRWCAIAVFTDEEWECFVKAIGNPTWTKDPKFSTLRLRKVNEDELDKLVEEWTINYSAEDVMNKLQILKVSAGALQTSVDLLEHDPQLKYRHFFDELDHPEIGKYHAVRPPYILSRSTCELHRAPLLGEHSEYILKEIVRMSDDEIAQLVMDGVVK